MTSDPLHWVVVDIEIPTLPHTNREGQELETLDERFTEAKLRGEMTAACLWDSAERWLPVYGPDEYVVVADRLEEADVVVTYSGVRFDVPLLENAIGRSLRLPHHVDIYEMIRDTIGNGRKGENTLDATAKRTLGRAKIGSGEHATDLWSNYVDDVDRRRAATTLTGLIRYCQWDVVLTRNLLEHIRDHGQVIGVNGPIRFDIPDWWQRLR